MRILLGACAAAILVLSACSGVDEPRWAESTGAQSTVTFDSPRREIVVQAQPDIGNVSFRGTVRGRDPVTIIAATNGRVLDVFVAAGDPVSANDPVLTFLQAPSEAELIQLEIAELQISQAIAESASEVDVSVARAELEALQASFDARTQTISAPASGVLGGTRQGTVYSVKQDDVLFEIADPNDIVVEIPITVTDAESLNVGAPVAMTRSGTVGDQVLSGAIASLPTADELARAAETERGALAVVTATVTLDDPTEVMLGDRLLVSLPAQVDSSTTWIPLDVVRSQGGSSYVLTADDQAGLQRVDVVLGRRTETHVQVLSTLRLGLRLVTKS